MAYEVLARRWRPQQFSEVVGQEHVTQTLCNAIEAERIAHAYIFVGPRGIGKTTLARIFAKALNCEKGPTTTPCNACTICAEISAGTNLNVLEIDGASNNKVDEVRELLDTVKYIPVQGNYKIYIIDEVHMLSTAAFNALLKTLEEPPPHVKFIFATTEPHQILSTILSRCQRFDLRRIPSPLIVEWLAKVARAEGVSVDNDALLAIARGAEGAMRDAASTLDQLISFKGDTICEDDVLSVFGMVARRTLEELAGEVLQGHIPAILRIVRELDAAGKDVQRLVFDLLDHCRNLLVCLALDGDVSQAELTEAQGETLRAQAGLTDMDRVLRITNVLIESDNQMRHALSKRTLLETTLIRCARTSGVVSLPEILRRVEALREGGDGTASQPRGESRAESEPAQKPEPAPKKKLDPAADLAALEGAWHEIIDRAGRVTVMARSCFLYARPIRVDESQVEIAFDLEFSENLENASTPRIRQTMQRIVSKVLGREVALEYTLSEGMVAESSKDRSAKEPVVGNDSQDAAESPVEGAKPAADDELIQDPAVTKALEVFHGWVVDVRK